MKPLNGRRPGRSIIAAVAIALVLLVLGVSQASAAVPTINSFSPSSGPVGTSVGISGTGFSGTTSVTFNATAATMFTVDSDVQITATVPIGATTGPITVTNTDGTATSSTSFTVIVSPTITDITPNRGEFRTTVTITGTGFTGVTEVTFNGVSATFTVVSDTEITAKVPSGAGTGPITVTNASGTATSPSNFRFLLDRHRSSIVLELDGHLSASGDVRIPDGTGICDNARRVAVQRNVSGSWRTIRRDTTGATGRYHVNLPDRSGKYRAQVAGKKLENDACEPDVSRTKTYTKPQPEGGGGGGGSNCTPGYSPCLIYHGGADYDCAGGSGNGPYYTEPGVVYNVTGSDPYGLDADNDGRGCE
jgi:hypothetical protein